jgi:hypothetical protein
MDSASFNLSPQRSPMVYDAPLAWLRHATAERGNWPARAA